MSKELLEVLIKRIEKRSSIPLDQYMKLCLYHPALGYYSRAGITRWGRKGDYFTSVSVGKTFGQLIAFTLVDLAKKMRSEKELTLVELGAGNGSLAFDILKALKEFFPEYYLKTRYLAVEQNPVHIESIKRKARKINEVKVETLRNFKQVGKVESGIIFANELIDSLPVKQVKMSSSGPLELYIGLRRNKLTAYYQPTRSLKVMKYLQKQKVKIKINQTREINFAARKLLAELASLLKSGFLLLIDYGGLTEEILARSPEGTLRGFFRHRLITDLTFRPGETDLTSDVNFSDLIDWAKEFGLKLDNYQNQLNFFAPLAEKLISRISPKSQQIIKNQLKILIHPEFLGERFKVLTLKGEYAKSR